MTHFEYITIAVSIILALGIAQLLDGVGPALRKEQRYWTHVGWLVQKFFNILLWWWGLWTAREIEWNLGLFLYEICAPVIFYLQAKALVTPSLPGQSWRDRFYEIRVWFFVGNIALSIITIAGILLFGVTEIATKVPIAALVLLLMLAVVGLLTTSPRVHAVIVTIAITVQALGLAAFSFEFGP